MEFRWARRKRGLINSELNDREPESERVGDALRRGVTYVCRSQSYLCKRPGRLLARRLPRQRHPCPADLVQHNYLTITQTVSVFAFP